MKQKIPVVVLAGGQGMRIREETEFRPKPMIPIGERPILWHIMKTYGHYGFDRFIVCLGYKGDVIKQYFLHYSLMHTDFTIGIGKENKPKVHNTHPEESWKVTLAETGLNTMTGARIKRIENYVETDTFMVTYGDGVANINIQQLLKFHRSHGKIATVTGVNPPSRFGELVIDKKHRVVDFSEKPHISERLINGGFFVFDRRVFDYLQANEQCVLEKEPLERLARDGELMNFAHTDFWYCMDTIRDMNHLTDLWKQNKAPWKVWKD